MFELIIETDFSAAHNLRGYKGQCENLHGHNWKVQVVLKAEKLNSIGMVMDFREVKEIAEDIIMRFDHAYLNDLPDFKVLNPTTENLSRILYNELKNRLPAGISVGRVTTWESDRCGAVYFE
ncbi:MAG: 6-carboxytetrahydropterin synthase QueD [wastewater metagenome]|nr:6-carboxytetrahydropterin synthase QueD [Candidatus Loosdrechtia aerotolerans]